ncbi:MAG: DUF465 domain-containing protein [Candidatus Aminicenantales bacterium]
MDEKKIRERMLAENEEFRKLDKEHRKYEDELKMFEGKAYLTPEEELRERELKKRKLAIKDRMYLMMREYKKFLKD